MRLYLDDDLDSNALIALLRRGGHEVVSPRVAGTRGLADEEHMHYAVTHGLVLLTANAEDFLNLHLEWTAQHQGHSGILVVYRENNPARDMTFEQIARAVTQLEQSGLPIANVLYNLNFWRPRETWRGDIAP
jgi:predicted nuclease of predicted toxin-antitoxin system